MGRGGDGVEGKEIIPICFMRINMGCGACISKLALHQTQKTKNQGSHDSKIYFMNS